MIQKTVVTITILHEAGDDISACSLETIHYEITEGGWLGQLAVHSSEPVPAHRVREECLALGNDGTFFNVEEPEE